MAVNGATVHLHTPAFLTFLRLADSQHRPVGEVLAEWLSDCAKLIGEADLFDEAPLRAPLLTNAMVLARHREEQAAASTFVDDEITAYEFYAAGAGYVDAQLAQD